MTKSFVRALVLVGLISGLAACAQQEAKPVVQKPKEELISLLESKRGAALAVSDRLLFDVARADLKPDAAGALDQIAKILKLPRYANTVVLVEGHTDNTGSQALNEKLSRNRALAVRQALIERDIPAKRLVAKGYAALEPRAPNDSEENRSRNRRVEVVFTQESLESLKANID